MRCGCPMNGNARKARGVAGRPFYVSPRPDSAQDRGICPHEARSDPPAGRRQTEVAQDADSGEDLAAVRHPGEPAAAARAASWERLSVRPAARWNIRRNASPSPPTLFRYAQRSRIGEGGQESVPLVRRAWRPVSRPTQIGVEPERRSPVRRPTRSLLLQRLVACDRVRPGSALVGACSRKPPGPLPPHLPRACFREAVAASAASAASRARPLRLPPSTRFVDDVNCSSSGGLRDARSDRMRST